MHKSEGTEHVQEKKPVISQITSAASQASSNSTTVSTASNEWNDEEIKLLVKAVKIISVGTRDR